MECLSEIPLKDSKILYLPLCKIMFISYENMNLRKESINNFIDGSFHIFLLVNINVCLRNKKI